tara:strand:+ start:8201 stop:8701 length:501 start_codon:yes stop_codon:yes gene_type:complete
MKKIILLISLVTFLVACEQTIKQPTDNNPMSGYILGDDVYTQGVEKFMKAYTDNNFENAQDIFAENAIFSVNDVKMGISDMMTGFAVGHQYFDNISHNNVDIATMHYNNGNVFTNVWYDWSGIVKSTGDKLELRGYGWFKWENEKVIEAYNAFDPTAYNAVLSSQQ